LLAAKFPRRNPPFEVRGRGTQFTSCSRCSGPTSRSRNAACHVAKATNPRATAPANARTPSGFKIASNGPYLQVDEEGRNSNGDNRRSTPGFGLSLGDLTPDIARQLALPVETHGALVESVEPFTPASDAGVKRGDVILEVNRNAVSSASEAARELHRISSGQPAFLLLLRNGNRVFMEMRKE
jgi:S1-C subfamily serine protease